MKTFVATLRFGNPEYLTRCAPSLDHWCSRWSLDLNIYDDTPRGYPSVKFCELDALRDFLKSDAERFLWVDADVLVHPDAPAPDFGPGFHAATCKWHQMHEAHWKQWCKDTLNYDAPEYSTYFNAGVFACDRNTAKQFLAVAKPPYHEMFQEQHQWNAWLCMAGITVIQMPNEWNRFGRDIQSSWFFHLWGDHKMRDLADIDRSGVLSTKPDGLVRSRPPREWPQEWGKTVVTRFIKDAGLGNQMFEWAAGLSIARKLNLPFRWVWEPTTYRDFGLHHFGIGELPFRDLKVCCGTYGQGNAQIAERITVAVDEWHEPEAVIRSPFQAEECFANVADEIREIYRVKPYDLDVPAGKTPVGMQVRRGDYVGHPRLDVTNVTYFRNAMDVIRRKVKRPHFFVVSDGPDWCQKEFGSDPDVTVMGDQTPIDSLRVMAACEAHIISNSTFGWWGAWLHEKGPVVAPDRWFTEKGKYGPWNPVPNRWLRASTEVPAKIEILGTPQHERAIVIPWKHNGEKWHELRYALRSIEKHFADTRCPIAIFGTQRPHWLLFSKHRVQFHDCWSYKEAVTRGVQFAEKVAWWNDDIMLLKDTEWDDLKTPLHLGPVTEKIMDDMIANPNPWRNGVLRVIRELDNRGFSKPLIYSTHTPYLYDREVALDVLREFGVWEKIPLEMAYFNTQGIEGTRITDERTQGVPFGDARFLNLADHLLTQEVKDAVMERFPNFAEWELKVKF